MASPVESDSNVNLATPSSSVEESKKSQITSTTEQVSSNDIPAATIATTTANAPGSFQKSNGDLPEWYNVGWTAFSELPNPGQEQDLETLKKNLGGSSDALVEAYSTSRPDKIPSKRDLIAHYLSEAYYGEWYHNAGVMLVAVASTWAQTKLGGGLMGCLVIGAFLGTYYQTSIRRLRRNMRDDLQRELMATRLLTDVESADWINNFMNRFWLIYEPGLSAQIISTADAILIESTPSFLDSIRLSTFTLGTKAPRIEGIKTYPRTEPNVVCMDWKVSFVPNDTTDLTKREVDAKVNPKIILTIRVGKGMLGAGMPILLEDLSFTGNMRLKFKFYNEFPHIKTVEASFLEAPEIDYSLKPVGGETFGFDINMIPGLEPFIKEQIHATLGPMMYAPNVYTVDMTGNVASLDDANGVAAITLYSGSNLKAADFFGSLDPYVSFHVGNIHNVSVSETKAIEDTNNPKWNETHFVLLNNLNQSIYFQLMDRNFGRKDAQVGVANLELQSFETDPILEGKNLVVLRNGKPVGELKADIRYLPVSKPEKKEDGTIIPPPESDSGVLRFYIHECKQLGGDTRKSSFGILKSDVSAYAVVKVNGHEKLRTKPFKRSFNPTWNKFVDVFVPDKTKLDLGVTIWDSKEFADDSLVGRWNSSLVQFQEQITNDSQDWWNLTDGAGRIHLSMTWKPVIMTGVNSDISGMGYLPPIGVIRLNLFGARDIKNVEALTGGKSDPYARVLSGMQIRGRTERVDDNLDPDWNTVLYVPVHTIREDLIIEVMDYNDVQKDKSLGVTPIILKDIIQERTDENGQTVYEAKEALDRTINLTNLERTKSKGTIHYGLSFHPTLELAKKAEEEEKDKQEGDESQQPATDQDKAEAETKETAVGEQTDETKDTDAASADSETPPEKDIHGELIKYTEDKKIDLISYESGILSVTVQLVKLPQRTRAAVDVLVDSNDPQFVTSQLKGVELPYYETGDAFVKEMDFSRLVVNVKRATDNEKEHEVIGYYTTPVRDIVRQIMNGEHDPEAGKEYNLLDCPDGVVKLAFKFTPVIQFKLDPAESLENQGNLTVTALKATDLKAADKSGLSDPYLVFMLDDEKVHKTEPIKKTLNPVFKNESFTVPVISRIHSVIKVSVYDWDQIGTDELIGEGIIRFSGEQLESFAAKDFEINLEGGGKLKVRLLWQPQLLARKRTGTSLFSATTRMFTHVPGTALGAGKTFAGAGIGAGGKVLGAGGKVLGSGFDAIGGGIRSIGKFGNGHKKEEVPVPVATTSTTSSASGVPAGTPEAQRYSTSTISSNDRPDSSSISNESGASRNIQITLLGARNLKAMDRGGTSDPYCRVRIGNKAVYKTKHIKKTLTPEWNEKFTAKAENGKLDIMVKDHNTLTDVDIGGVVFDVSSVLQTGQAFDGWLTLSPAGTGEIHIRVD